MPFEVSKGYFLASYIHSHADGSAYVCHICSQSVQLFGIFPTLLKFWPPNGQMILGLEGLIFLAACIH